MFRNLLTISLLFLISCGNDITLPESNTETVVILNSAFQPQSLTAEAGDRVFFLNQSLFSHVILSQSDEDVFDDTGDFESDFIDIDEVRFIDLPDDANPGDVFYFYSRDYAEEMPSPNGTITIE